MDREVFKKKIVSILEDFDSKKEIDCNVFAEQIIDSSEIYFADKLKIEQKKAVIKYLIEQVNMYSK